jgi:hypothetical protein
VGVSVGDRDWRMMLALGLGVVLVVVSDLVTMDEWDCRRPVKRGCQGEGRHTPSSISCGGVGVGLDLTDMGGEIRDVIATGDMAGPVSVVRR